MIAIKKPQKKAAPRIDSLIEVITWVSIWVRLLNERAPGGKWIEYPLYVIWADWRNRQFLLTDEYEQLEEFLREEAKRQKLI